MIKRSDDKGEKVALAAITGLLSLVSGGVGGIVAGGNATEASKASGKAAASDASMAASRLSTSAVNEAASKAAKKASGEVSTLSNKKNHLTAAARQTLADPRTVECLGYDQPLALLDAQCRLYDTRVH
jgi:hypothetical protein